MIALTTISIAYSLRFLHFGYISDFFTLMIIYVSVFQGVNT
jgi:hypothetical protein